MSFLRETYKKRLEIEKTMSEKVDLETGMYKTEEESSPDEVDKYEVKKM